MRKLAIPALAATLLFGAVTAANATMIAGPSVADPSFEDPALSPGSYVYFPSTSGADFSAGLGGAGIQSNGSAFGFAPAPDGVQTAFIQTGGAISLDVSGLTVGHSYDFSFYIADRPGYAVNPILVSYTDTTDPVLGVYTPTGNTFEQVTTEPFTARASSGTLEFSSTTTGAVDTDLGLDKIGISAVPEPSIWSLLIVGIGGVGLAARRAKRRMGGTVADALAA